MFLVLLLLFFVSCRQQPPPLTTATQRVKPEGGVISLPGGVSTTFVPEFLTAEAAVMLSLSDAPLERSLRRIGARRRSLRARW